MEKVNKKMNYENHVFNKYRLLPPGAGYPVVKLPSRHLQEPTELSDTHGVL